MAPFGPGRASFFARFEGDALFFAGGRSPSSIDLSIRTAMGGVGDVAWPEKRRGGGGKPADRREDGAAFRDAVTLARPGQELGPAGRVYAAPRTLCGPGEPFRLERLAARRGRPAVATRSGEGGKPHLHVERRSRAVARPRSSLPKPPRRL